MKKPFIGVTNALLPEYGCPENALRKDFPFYCFFADYDNLSFEVVAHRTASVIQKHDLGETLILQTSKNHHFVVSPVVLDKTEWLNALFDSRTDFAFCAAAFMYGRSTWRLTRKKARDSFKLVKFMREKTGKNISEKHAELLEDMFGVSFTGKRKDLGIEVVAYMSEGVRK